MKLFKSLLSFLLAFCSAVEMGESKDLQKFLNGHIVDFSLKDRAIGGYRQ